MSLVELELLNWFWLYLYLKKKKDQVEHKTLLKHSLKVGLPFLVLHPGYQSGIMALGYYTKARFPRQGRGGLRHKGAHAVSICLYKSQNQGKVISGVGSQDGFHSWGSGKLVPGRKRGGPSCVLVTSYLLIWALVSWGVLCVKSHQATPLQWMHISVRILHFSENFKMKKQG